ncbi:MAG: glycine zipper 2TM domain-containing protein [Rhodospirillales bacterium]|nr:glycine zipper 2TM domain-containing protein [Rhodospirillales bacterium]
MPRRNQLKKLSVVLLLATTLTACESAQNAPKQTVGTLLGAGTGALVGSQVGGGKGKLVAVVIGTLGGAFLGSQIGKSLDTADRLMMEKNAQSTLEYSKVGTSTAWKNPDSGNSGTFRPTRTYAANSGETCREYESTIYVDGREETATGRACRQPDGTWKIAN